MVLVQIIQKHPRTQWIILKANGNCCLIANYVSFSPKSANYYVGCLFFVDITNQLHLHEAFDFNKLPATTNELFSLFQIKAGASIEIRKKMETFQVLKMSQAFLSRLGIYSYRLTEPINEFFSSFSTYYILCNLTFTLISSTTFIYQSSCELKITLQLWLIIIGAIQCSGMYLNIGLKMRQVKVLHLKLQEIVDVGLYFVLILS